MRLNLGLVLPVALFALTADQALAQSRTTPVAAPRSAKAPTPGLYVSGSASDCRKVSWEDMFIGGVLQIGRGEQLDSSSRVLDSNRIQRSELNEEGEKEAITYYRCDERVLPADAHYFDEPRKVAALPIKPGYYVLRYEDSVVEYFLFDTNRIAWMDVVARDPQFNPTRLANAIRPLNMRQVGPRVYTFTYQQWPGNANATLRDSKVFIPVLIEAPDRFSGWFHENGMMRYEPVDAKKIPAALRPHF